MTATFLLAFNSCGNKDEMEDETSVLVDDDSDVFSDDLGEDIFGDDDDDDEDFLFSETADSDSDDDDDTETDFTSVPSNDSKPDYSAPAKTTTSSRPKSSSGQYMVIAGNYLVKANADQMIRKLRNLGYDNAEIGIFERSQYHTVIASRHSSNSAALSSANDIKYKGVDCYVKKKTY